MAEFELLLDNWLEDVTPRVTMQAYTEINFVNGVLIPTTVDLDISTKVISEFTAQVMGEPDIDDELSDEIPESSIKIGKDEYRTWHTRQGFHYKHEQLLAYRQASAKSKAPLAAEFLDMPARTAVQVLMRKGNPLAAYGRGSSTGLLNDANLPTNPSATALYTTAVTNQQLLDFLIAEIENVITTNSIEDDMASIPNTILAPIALRRKMKTPQLTLNGTVMSVEKALMMEYDNITKIHYTNFCSNALLAKYGVQTLATNRDRLLFYQRNNSDFLRRRMSTVVNYPSSYNKGTYWAGMIQTFGQTVWTNPTYARLVTFPNNTV